MGQSASSQKTQPLVAEADDQPKKGTTLKFMRLGTYASVTIVFAVFAMLSIVAASIIYAVLLDNVEPLFFNPINHQMAVKNGAAYQLALAFAVGSIVVGMIWIISISTGPQAVSGVFSIYQIVSVWEGIALFALIGYGTVYTITLVGIVNSACDDYAICCAAPVAGTCPAGQVMSLWLGVLSTTIIAVILSWFALLLLLYRSYKGYGYN